MPEQYSRWYVFLLIAFTVFSASLLLTTNANAIEPDCTPSGSNYYCAGGRFCQGSFYTCNATCSSGNRNGVPYCNATNTGCIYPCSSGGSGSPKPAATWVRVFTVNHDGNNYWGPESQVGVLGGVTGPNRVDDAVAITAKLNSDSLQTGVSSAWAVWSEKFCGRAAPQTINAQGDLTPVGSRYCAYETRDSGQPTARTWCKADQYSASNPTGGGGCQNSPWFISYWPAPSYASPNGDEGDHHDGNYYLLDEIDGMIEYLRNTSTIPTAYKYQNYNNRFTFNIVSRSEYPVRVTVTPPLSYYCDHAYYSENNVSGRTVGNVSSTNTYVDPVTGQCSFDHHVESNGNFLFVDVKKQVTGRVVGLNYANSTSVGLANVTVRLRAGTSPSSTPSLTLTDQTDANGYYLFRHANFSSYPYYTLDVTNSTTPAGYVGSAYAIRWNSLFLPNGSNVAYSWRMVGYGSTSPINAAGDTKVGESAYHNQTLSAIPSYRDCSSAIPGDNYPAGRCWFGYRFNQPVSQPIIQQPVACLVTTGNETIRWTPSVDADAGKTITYNLRIYSYPSGCTGVGTQTLTGCTGSLLHAPAAIANTITSGYVNYSGYNFASAGIYHILLQSVSSDGSRSNWGALAYTANDKPTVALSSTITELGNGSVRASWTHTRGTSFSLSEDSVAVGSSTATTSPQTLDVGGACDGVAHAYRVRATNACGFTDSNIVNNTCTTTAPVCGTIQWNNAGTWTNYTTAQSMTAGTTRQFRVSSVTGGVAPLSYTWTNTCTPQPSVTNPATPTTATIFTAPSTGGQSCVLTFRANGGGTVPKSCSVAANITTPTTCGTTTFSGLALSKTSRTGTITHTVTGLSATGPGTATIQTTAGTICDPAIGTCTWATNGSVPVGTSSRTINVTLKNNNYGIRAGGLFQLRVGFTAPGCTARTDIGTVTVADSPPSCTAVSFGSNPYKFPGTLNTTFTVQDDFALKDFGVQLFYPDTDPAAPVAGDLYKWSPSASSTVGSPDAFVLRSPITDTNDSRNIVSAWAETAATAAPLPSGRYYARGYVSDWYGYYATPYTSERYRWCPPAAGYNPIVTIDHEAPTCNLVAFNPVSPSATSPVTISATATDNWSQLRTARFLVYATGVDRDAVPAPTPLLDQTQSFTVAAATATTRTLAWNTSTLPRGSYAVYVDWTDQLGNRTNTTELNQCAGTFEIPSYFRTTVEYPKDPILEDGRYVTQYGTTVYESIAMDTLALPNPPYTTVSPNTSFEFQIRKNGGVWLAEASSGSWVDNVVPNCRPVYADTIPETQHDTVAAPCNAYYRSAATYIDTDTANIRIKLPYVNKPKYTECTISIYNDADPSAAPLEPETILETGPAGYQYCRPAEDFNVLQGTTSSGPVANMYPTRVEFQLSYATDRIVGRVQGPDPTNPNVFMFSPPYVSGVTSPHYPSAPMSVFGANAYYVIPTGGVYSYPENYWAKGSTASVNIIRNTSHANTNLAQECYYLYDGTNAKGGAAVGDTTTIHNWFKNGEMTRGISAVGDYLCNISPLTIPGYDDSGFTPSSQAKLYTIVGPRIAVSSSTVTLVDDVASCGDVGQTPSAFPGVSDITMRLSGGTVDATTTVTATTGAFTFGNTPLDLNEDYTLAISEIREGSTVLDLSNFGFCSGSNAETLDLSALFPNYPLGSELGVISRNIKIFKKDTNSWFQVYNGGVHTNEQLTVNSNDGSAQGMPTAGVLVGNPGSDSTIPTGFNMYGTSGVNQSAGVCSSCAFGGLVSSFGLATSDEDFKKFGLDNQNWSSINLSVDNSQPVTFPKPLAAQFATVQALAGATPPTWTAVASVSSAINHITELKTYYYSATSPASISSVVNLGVGRRVAFINVQNGSGTLNINSSINSVDLSRGLLLYVNGNVFIAPSVTELDGVSIIASGNITIGSTGENLDNPLNIRGALYSNKQIDFQRNLNETNAAYIDSPSTRVLFDPRIISQSNTLPAEITVSNVYYEVQD